MRTLAPSSRQRAAEIFLVSALLLLLAAFPLAAQEEPEAPADPAPSIADPVEEEITVTATRTEQRLGETAASVVVLSSEEVASTAAQTVDDVLRQVPGFSLFRRSGSRYANPTAQGVSLRGLGASGASRAVVLADGIPLNDPFGGWVYWSRVPRTALDRVEVLRGAASDLYGSGALAGAVQLFRRGALPGQILAEVSYGEQGTPEASFFGSHGNERWGVSLAAEGFETDGYVAIDPRERGAVDTPVASRRSTVDLTLEHRTDGGARLFLRGSRFEEERENGTVLQVNDTEIRQWSAGAEGSLPDFAGGDGGSYWLRAYAGDQDFRQTFTAVAADRSSERLTRSQEVPAESRGLSAQVSRAVGGRLALVAGLDLREVSGTSQEIVFAGTSQNRVDAGGTQQTGGLFLEGLATLTPRLSLTLGGRLDGWRNDPLREAPDRDETAFSPRFSLLFKATDALSLTAAAYRAFRAPTLNELYRAFRVGDVLTLANEDLEAERLSGGEAGALWKGPGGLSARGTLFWMEIDRNIANVTLTVEPGLITRQRQNLGRTRSRGLEAEVTARPGERWTLSGGYLFSDARVASFPANPELEELRLPQIPRHQVTLQARFEHPDWVAVGVQARWTGEQPDDDQNRFPLGSFTTVDALVSRPLWKGFSAFVAVENLFDERYEIGRTPIRTFGPPRAVRIGLRVERLRD